jgi:hypothetical protein
MFEKDFFLLQVSHPFQSVFSDLFQGKSYFNAELPDGIFSKQKSQYGYILESLTMEDVGLHMLWTFGIY